MEYSSHRIRAQEKKVVKKLVWSLIFLLGGMALAVFAGLPLLAKLAVGISLIRGEQKATNETVAATIFPPVLESLPSATNSATLMITGYSEKEMEIIVSVNGEKSAENFTDEEGKFKFRGIQIKPGENKISVVAKFKDQTSQPAEFSIDYKKDPPKLEISEPSDGQTLYGEAKTAIIGATDPDVNISINERFVIVGRDGSFSFLTPLNNGENVLKIKAVDDAGNIKESEIKINYSP